MVIGTQINYYVALVEYLTIEMFFIVTHICISVSQDALYTKLGARARYLLVSLCQLSCKWNSNNNTVIW